MTAANRQAYLSISRLKLDGRDGKTLTDGMPYIRLPVPFAEDANPMPEEYPFQQITKRVLFVQDVIRNEAIVRMPLNPANKKELAEFLRMLSQYLAHTAALAEEWPNYVGQ